MDVIILIFFVLLIATINPQGEIKLNIIAK